MRRAIVLSVVALLLNSAVVWAQEPTVVVPGGRIRITESGAGKSERHSGTVVTAGADTVVLRLDRDGESVSIPVASISRVEFSRGLKRHIAAGVGLGFLAGAGVGAVVGATSKCGTCGGGEDDATTKILTTLAWTGIGGGVGMLVGGLIGARHKTEGWESMPSNRLHFSARPAGAGGFALALSVRI